MEWNNRGYHLSLAYNKYNALAQFFQRDPQEEEAFVVGKQTGKMVPSETQNQDTVKNIKNTNPLFLHDRIREDLYKILHL